MRFWTEKRWSERVAFIAKVAILGPAYTAVFAILCVGAYRHPFRALCIALSVVAVAGLVAAWDWGLHRLDRIEDRIKGIERERDQW